MKKVIAVDKEMQSRLDAAYCSLETKCVEVVNALLPGGFQVETAWYNGHYHRDESGSWVREAYPIPVISVKGLFDIEVMFDKLCVTAKLQRNAALSYSFEQFCGYEFEAYGVDDYLADFYHTGQTIQEMKDNIISCDDKEIGFSFMLPFELGGECVFEFVKLLHREGFYY